MLLYSELNHHPRGGETNHKATSFSIEQYQQHAGEEQHSRKSYNEPVLIIQKSRKDELWLVLESLIMMT
jgi:hypothetical protein